MRPRCADASCALISVALGCTEVGSVYPTQDEVLDRTGIKKGPDRSGPFLICDEA